jgi:hypothetical protein
MIGGHTDRSAHVAKLLAVLDIDGSARAALAAGRRNSYLQPHRH